MKLLYTMTCFDEESDEMVAVINSYSEEGLLEESGKRKWTDTIKRYEDEQKSPERFNIEDRPVNERLETERFYESKEGL